jgi:hypothetical protein
MHAYEIRISKEASPPGVIWVSPHPSTYAALCKARAHAAQGDVVEVWRDHLCVYREVVGAPA